MREKMRGLVCDIRMSPASNGRPVILPGRYTDLPQACGRQDSVALFEVIVRFPLLEQARKQGRAGRTFVRQSPATGVMRMRLCGSYVRQARYSGT